MADGDALALRPVLAVALVVVALAPVFALALVLQLGIGGLAGFDEVDYVGPWALGPALGLVLLCWRCPAAALTIATLEALYRVLCVITPALLAPRAAAGGPVREMLAESLGDRTVSVAYWLPDRERFVDEHGRPVTLPEPGSGRAWTAVERDGRRVAAIIHDASLDTSRGAGRGGGRGVLAGDRQRAAEGRPAGARGGAAGLAAADHGGGRPGAAADRAQPPRRRAAAARGAGARAAGAEGAREGPGSGR